MFFLFSLFTSSVFASTCTDLKTLSAQAQDSQQAWNSACLTQFSASQCNQANELIAKLPEYALGCESEELTPFVDDFIAKFGKKTNQLDAFFDAIQRTEPVKKATQICESPVVGDEERNARAERRLSKFESVFSEQYGSLQSAAYKLSPFECSRPSSLHKRALSLCQKKAFVTLLYTCVVLSVVSMGLHSYVFLTAGHLDNFSMLTHLIATTINFRVARRNRAELLLEMNRARRRTVNSQRYLPVSSTASETSDDSLGREAGIEMA